MARGGPTLRSGIKINRILLFLGLAIIGGVALIVYFFGSWHGPTCVLQSATAAVLLLVALEFMGRRVRQRERDIVTKHTKLLREKDFSDQLLQMIDVLVMVISMTGQIVLVNRRGLEILGVEETDVTGSNWIERFLPDLWQHNQRNLESLVEQGELPLTYTRTHQTPAGDQRVLSWSNRVLEDDEGYPYAILSTAHDVTHVKHMERELTKLSRTDYLTGLFNTRYFYSRLEEEQRRASRYHAPLSLLYIDLDNFKRCNDTFGHQEGDRALRLFADILRQELRDVDTLFRYGGEEFVVIMPHTGKEAARQAAERLRVRVEMEFQHNYHITVSIGVALYRSGIDLVQQADRAMYVAKRQGKNRVSTIERDS